VEDMLPQQVMELFLLKNEDGTQSVSIKLNDSKNNIGVWKIKSFKYDFIHSIVSKYKYTGNLGLEEIYKRNLAYRYTIAINHLLRNRPIKIVKNELYISIIKYIKSISNFTEYVTIDSILKHFEATSTPIQKQVLTDMVKARLLFKSYHKVRIIKKGFEYID